MAEVSFIVAGSYLIFIMGYYLGRYKMRDELYKEYKLRADRGAEPLAIDILVNRISNGKGG